MDEAEKRDLEKRIQEQDEKIEKFKKEHDDDDVPRFNIEGNYSRMVRTHIVAIILMAVTAMSISTIYGNCISRGNFQL